MRVVIDTNILVSALIAPAGKPCYRRRLARRKLYASDLRHARRRAARHAAQAEGRGSDS